MVRGAERESVQVATGCAHTIVCRRTVRLLRCDVANDNVPLSVISRGSRRQHIYGDCYSRCMRACLLHLARRSTHAAAGASKAPFTKPPTNDDLSYEQLHDPSVLTPLVGISPQIQVYVRSMILEPCFSLRFAFRFWVRVFNNLLTRGLHQHIFGARVARYLATISLIARQS